MIEQEYYKIPELWAKEKYLSNSFERERLEAAVNIVPLEIASVLDVGCGNGVFLEVLAGKGVEGVGLERSRNAISAKNGITGKTIILGDLTQIPFPTRSFPLVSCLEVLEHLPVTGFQKALDEISRVAGQYVLVSVPLREKRIYIRCPNCGCSFNPYYHLNVFNINSLQNLFPEFEMSGYSLVVSKDVFYIGYYLDRIYAYLFNPKEFKVPEKLSQSFCPACGYRKQPAPSVCDSKKPSVTANIKRLGHGMLKKLPFEKYTIITAIYKRKQAMLIE